MTSTRNKGINFPMEMVRLDLIKLKEINGFSTGNRNYVSSGKFVKLNIMPNSWGELQVLSNLNFKHCSTKYNFFTITKHLNSRM